MSGSRTTVNLDDMFGFRHVLATLPDPHGGAFLEEWQALAEVSGGDLDAMYAWATCAAKARAHCDEEADPGAAAWLHVSETMGRYLAWKGGRDAGADLLGA